MTICLLIAGPPAAFAQTDTLILSATNLSLIIPDDDPNGIVTSLLSQGLSGKVVNVNVSLDLVGTGGQGAFNSDYYVELVNSQGGLAVLLNRAGMSSDNPFGYGDDGFDVTFNDSAGYDIHFYQDVSYALNDGGQLTGDWQPDGENIDPQSSEADFDDALENQTAMLDSFAGDDPNDQWTLLIVDLSGGGTGELAGWTVSITVPEPPEASLIFLGLIVLFACLRRRLNRCGAHG